uniref:Uncharacterized protein n=1 Tax=Arundo donax TaxID=35708 RepID=A0A0A9H553_ARUDO
MVRHLQFVLEFALLLKPQCVHLFSRHQSRDLWRYPKMKCLHLFLSHQESKMECLHLNNQPWHRSRMKQSSLLQISVIEMQCFHLSSCCNNSDSAQLSS